MKDRFDLENEIVSIYSFCEHLDDVVQSLIEEEDVDLDNIANRISAISTLLGHHSDKMMDTMCQTLRLDEYNCY